MYHTSRCYYTALCYRDAEKQDRAFDARQRLEEAQGFHRMMAEKRRNFLERTY